VIDAFVKIKPAGGSGDVETGPECVINSGCVLYTGNGIRMGARMAANCTFAPDNHEFRRRVLPIREQGFRPSKGGIVIEDDVWISANCVLLNGALLRQGCVIAAGSVVRGKIEAYSIQGGNPLKLLGRREVTGN